MPRHVSLVLLLLATPACSHGAHGLADAGGLDGTAACVEGALSCAGSTVLTCRGGVTVPGEICGGGLFCVNGLGCTMCVPGSHFCSGSSEVRLCDATGAGSTPVSTCAATEVCRGGFCENACDAARADRSNVGCEYWAVDLDNEYANGPLIMIDAAGQPFAVAIANPSDVTVHAVIEQNDAAPGAAPSTSIVDERDIAPNALAEVRLPQREVDGSVMLRDDGPGTWLSSNAYRITTNYPVVAYQFNPIVQDFSNDASLLIPTSGLDGRYRVLGWPTANPISLPGLGITGIPDHSFITIVGVAAATTVTVTLGGPIVAGGSVPATAAGGTVVATLGPFDVLNLESDMVPGDLSGTVIDSDRPVAVFSGGERGAAPMDTTGVPPPPGGPPSDLCCTDHLEEQVFPTTAWGQDFVVTRSPLRSGDATYREPDLYRVQADKDGTSITTNLPGAFATFTLGANEWHDFWADRSFVLRATDAVQIEQILVSQQWVGTWRDGNGGDPSMTLFPPREQYRDHYLFLTPSTWSASYVVIGMPEGTMVLLDGRDVNADEFRMICTYEVAGMIDATTYDAVTCPVDPGVHTVAGSVPIGITVYGYYSRGSYGYAGGSNLTRINLI